MAGALAGILTLSLGADPAVAIPWDAGGAIPPSRTPPPTRPDPDCLQSYANGRPMGGPKIDFGIGPLLAGSSGTAQTPVVPENRAKADAALRRLKGKRSLGVRLNRLFMSDGDTGIRTYQQLASRFGALGLDVTLQVRYHPAPADNGNIARWLDYVRQVVRALGPNKRVKFLQITNEVNLSFSPNTSDGAWLRATDALVQGVEAAKRESLRLGYRQLRIGFNYAWRVDIPNPGNYSTFWKRIGSTGGRQLRKDADFVGLDLYPGTFTPGILHPAQIVNIGDAFLEGIAQTRRCFMPQAGFTFRTPLVIDEIGFATGSNGTEAAQDGALRAFVNTAQRYRGTYNIRGFDWFGLRDNNTSSTSFQDHFGLLRDDYTPKPAFGTFTKLIKRYAASARALGVAPR